MVTLVLALMMSTTSVQVVNADDPGTTSFPEPRPLKDLPILPAERSALAASSQIRHLPATSTLREAEDRSVAQDREGRDDRLARDRTD